MDAVEFLKENVDFEQMLRHYNARRIRNHGQEIRCCCPIHGGNNPSAFVYVERTKLWYCHTGCKTGGDIYDLVRKMEKLDDFKVCVQRVADFYGIDISQMEITIRANAVLQEHRKWIATMQNMMDSNRVDRDPTPFDISMLGTLYPINAYRQFTKETLDMFQIKYCQANKRVVVPILHNDVCIGVTMRRTDNHPVKWMHQPSGLTTGNYLYNGDNLEQLQPAIITEGCFDVLNSWQNGYQNVVATFGCHLTNEQERLVLRKTYDIILAYDNDTAGIIGTKQVIERLKNKINIKIADIPKGKDVGELTKEELNNAINNALTIHQWKIANL